MGKTYDEAASVAEIAGGLIPNYHPELATARIFYVFVDKASQKGGRPVPGKVRKLSGLLEWKLESDFIIEVAADQWTELNAEQRTALVDHLLECCFGEEDESGGGDMKWTLREPDVHEFSSILQRHGAWNDSLAGFVSVAKEVDLDQIVQEEAEVTLEEVSTRT